jgi:hypothetical protein
VQIVRLEGTPDHHDETWIRLTQHGWWTADIGSVAELAQWFPLAELEPEDGLALGGAELARASTATAAAARMAVPASSFCGVPGDAPSRLQTA